MKVYVVIDASDETYCGVYADMVVVKAMYTDTYRWDQEANMYLGRHWNVLEETI